MVRRSGIKATDVGIKHSASGGLFGAGCEKSFDFRSFLTVTSAWHRNRYKVVQL